MNILVKRAIEVVESETNIPLVLEAAEGTCDWIFEHPNFLEWVGQQCRKPLWIGGIPGKSPTKQP
jgi:hypothetical protein